ncbi:ATP synthase F1 subunit gamma [Candidatus Magnetominusculus dajiuhuensis]|uniref:ATP synthase F1 subunit gamma n=1 Tax=Candidatus Magnetominusculus dajiuhuensis TaxID=3137712 RepID=UPI003B430B1E
MPSLRDIRNRITSVNNTGKITRAMQMISAAKLKKAQNSMLAARPYSNKIFEMLSYMASAVDREAYPLLNLRQRKVVELIVLTSDKGLCGAFNTNVLKETARLMKELRGEGIQLSIVAVGKKARDYFHRNGVPVRKTYIDFYKTVKYEDVREIATEVIDSYGNESIDELIIVYNEFKSLMLQTPKRARLLPIEPKSAGGVDDGVLDKFIFEPSEAEILNALLPKYVENQIFRAILESRVSEEAARMIAMENANKSTKELLEKLTLQYNKARQATITAELMDIVGGAEALSQ